jgi:hypothetical protein
MKWLSVKVSGLRHIIRSGDAGGAGVGAGANGTGSASTAVSRSSLSGQKGKRWTLMNDPNSAASEGGPVYLPMTQETAQ